MTTPSSEKGRADQRADTPRTAAGQRWWKALGGLPDDGAYIAAIEAEAAAEPAAAEPLREVLERLEQAVYLLVNGGSPEVWPALLKAQKQAAAALAAAQPPRGSLPNRPIDPNIALNRPMPLGGSLTATEPPLYCDHGRPIGPPCSECAAGLTATEPLAAAIKRMLGRKPGEDQRFDSGDLAGLVRPHDLADAILQEWQPSPPENPIAKGIREIRHAIHDGSPRGVTPALSKVAEIVRRHTHQGMWAMTRFAGPDPENDCLLCEALVSAGVLTLDQIGAGTRARLGSPEDSDAVSD